MMNTPKQIILINQLITDIMNLDDSGQEKEIGMILNKIKKLKDLEERDIEEAEKDDIAEELKDEPEEDGSIS